MLFVVGEVVEVDVPFGVQVFGVAVVGDVVGAKHHALVDDLGGMGVEYAVLPSRSGNSRLAAGGNGDGLDQPAANSIDWSPRGRT